MRNMSRFIKKILWIIPRNVRIFIQIYISDANVINDSVMSRKVGNSLFKYYKR